MATVLEEAPAVVPAELPRHFEVIRGQIVELVPMSDHARRVANRLNGAMVLYLNSNDIGECGTELMFRVPLPDDETRSREPDVSFVSYKRWPKDQEGPYEGNARDVMPELVVEVVSPTDKAEATIAKVREYQRGGALLVWVIYPIVREVHAFDSDPRRIRVFFAGDDLEAPEILPGFRVNVGSLFPPVADPPVPKDDQ